MMNNQNNTHSKETTVKFEYSILKDVDLQTVFEFYNWMHEDEPLTESMFLRAWDSFNEMKSKKEHYSKDWINLKDNQ